MISYEPFWKTIKEKEVTTYALIKKYNISNGTLYRMRKSKPISTTTINDLCKVLKCEVQSIIKYIDDELNPINQ